MHDSNPLRQFLILVFSLLLPCFALWALVSPWLALPAIGFSNMILSAWLPEIVDQVFARGAEAILVTQFDEVNGEIIPASGSGDSLAFIMDTRILSYSIPFYAALHFAVADRDNWGRFFGGMSALYVLLVFGLVTLALKDLLLNLGAAFVEHPDAAIPHPDVIAILYQFNVLITPTLAPILIWAWQHRAAPLFRSLPGFPRTAGDRDAD